MYKFNHNPELPSLSFMQQQVTHCARNPLQEGYKCYTGHILTANEAQALNHYVTTAMEFGIFNDQERLNDILDRKHRTFVMIAENHQYVIGHGYLPECEAREILKKNK